MRPVRGPDRRSTAQRSNAADDTLEGRRAHACSPPSTGRSGSHGGNDRLLERLRGDTALVEEQFAKAHHIRDRRARSTSRRRSGGAATLTRDRRVPRPADPAGHDRRPADSSSASRRCTTRSRSSSRASPGADRAQVQARIERRAAAASRPPRSRSSQQYRDLINQQVDQIVYLLYALLAMSLVISLFGIANSLFLAVHERTREFGLLRASARRSARSGASSATRA